MERLCEACNGKTYIGKNIITKDITVYCYDCTHKTFIKAVA